MRLLVWLGLSAVLAAGGACSVLGVGLGGGSSEGTGGSGGGTRVGSGAPSGGTSDGGRVGTVYFWMNVGAQNGKPLALPERVVEVGWARYAQEHAAAIRKFNAPGGVVVSNPCGQPTRRAADGRDLAYKSMAFNQRQMALDAGFTRVGSEDELYRGMMTIRASTDGDVWAYLGTARDEALSDDDVLFAVRPFVRAGCGIVLDAAGVESVNGHKDRSKTPGWQDGRPAWEIAQLLTSRGVAVGYEPRPLRGTPWAATGWPCFALAREKLDADGNRVDQGFLRSDPEKYQSSKPKNRDDELGDVILLISAKSSTDYVVDMLARGYSVAISGWEMNRRGLRAVDLIEQARRR